MSDRSTPRFRVSIGELVGQQLVVLSDDQAESQAQFVPGRGFHCMAFRAFVGESEWRVLAEPPDPEAFRTRLMRYGIPILFPWPNRVRGGRFMFGGIEYRLPMPPDIANASHGLARERAWTVEATGADEAGAFCRATVMLGNNDDDPWPFTCRLTMEYRLQGNALSIEAVAENVDVVPMPMGFGLHPWFAVPFAAGSARGGHELKVPAGEVWELESNLPTGMTVPAGTVFEAREWRPLDDILLDDVYTSLELDDGWFTARLRDPTSGREVAVRSDAAFREHVVYAPLHIKAVCLEPYTCATDAFNLAARGIDGGMLVLEPGARWQGRVVIEVRG